MKTGFLEGEMGKVGEEEAVEAMEVQFLFGYFGYE